MKGGLALEGGVRTWNSGTLLPESVQLPPPDGKRKIRHRAQKSTSRTRFPNTCACVNRPCPCVGGAREGQESRTVPYGDLSLPQGLGSPGNIKYMGGRHVKVLPAPTSGFKMQGQFWLPPSALKERWVEVRELVEWALQTLVENPAGGRRDLAAEFFQLCCRFENVHNGKESSNKGGDKR